MHVPFFKILALPPENPSYATVCERETYFHNNRVIDNRKFQLPGENFIFHFTLLVTWNLKIVTTATLVYQVLTTKIVAKNFQNFSFKTKAKFPATHQSVISWGQRWVLEQTIGIWHHNTDRGRGQPFRYHLGLITTDNLHHNKSLSRDHYLAASGEHFSTTLY